LFAGRCKGELVRLIMVGGSPRWLTSRDMAIRHEEKLERQPYPPRLELCKVVR
jgi:hypothetical protein